MAAKTQTFNTRQHMLKHTFEVFRYRDSYLHEVALHHHDFYEVYLFLSGNVRYAIESRTYDLMPGDILLISPMELHQPMLGRENRDYERIVLWIDPKYIQQYTDLGFNLTGCFDTTDPRHTNLLRPDSASRQMLIYLLEQLLEESDSREYAAELQAQTYLVQVLVKLNRMAEQFSRPCERKDRSDSVVVDVLSYINQHYSEDLTLDVLANKFFVSKYHLSREFNRLVGIPVYRYVIQKRLVIAKQLLSEGIPSGDVYQRCGFGDYSNFYRAFKAEYQMSPKEFVSGLKAVNQRPEDARRSTAWAAREQSEVLSSKNVK